MIDDYSVYELFPDSRVQYWGKAICFSGSAKEIYTPQELIEYEDPSIFGEDIWDGSNYRW